VIQDYYTRPLQQIICWEMDDFSGADIRVFSDFLSSMLQTDPADRLAHVDIYCYTDGCQRMEICPEIIRASVGLWEASEKQLSSMR
jgi:hypothetical protein